MDTLHKNYKSFQLAIIIPFFNEEKRISINSFTLFCNEHPDVLLLLVNDGSTDKTQEILEGIKNTFPDSIEIIKLDKNHGKGNAVRAGMEKAFGSKIPYTAYLDADLSAPFEEIIKLYELLIAKNYDAVFGSRLKKLGSTIQRSLFRHLTGRMIATIIDSKFKIGCYDTQCSAKVFKTTLLQPVTDSSFYTKWFFDIEIILRIKRKNQGFKVQEIPLDRWEHKPGSKINTFSIFVVAKEIFTLFNKY